MRTLIVSLPAAAAAPELAYVLTAEGRSVGAHGSAAPALLPQPAGTGTEVVAVVPAAALSWHRVNLPKGAAPGTPRLRAALEGLLEDQLLDEAPMLHFAVQPRARAGEAAWVGVCDAAWLRGWLQSLEAAGRPVSRIVPEFAPEGATALHAIGEPAQAMLVAAGSEGVLALPLSPTALALLPALDAETTACLAEPAVAAQTEQLLSHKFALQQAPQRWLAAARSDWDLAQFELASSGRARALKKLAGGWSDLLRAPQWRPARWGAALLVALNLVGLNAWAWKERGALQAKREAVRGTLTQTFPNVKVVVDAPLQMEREVAALRQATGAPSGRDLESLLGALAQSLPPDRPVGSFEYANGELRVRGVLASPEELRGIVDKLRSAGFGAVTQGEVLVLTREAAL